MRSHYVTVHDTSNQCPPIAITSKRIYYKRVLYTLWSNVCYIALVCIPPRHHIHLEGTNGTITVDYIVIALMNIVMDIKRYINKLLFTILLTIMWSTARRNSRIYVQRYLLKMKQKNEFCRQQNISNKMLKLFVAY